MTNPSGTNETNVTVPYEIKRALSRFTVQAFAGGLLSAFAHNSVISIPDFSGQAQIAEDITHSSFSLRVNAASLTFFSDVSDKDRGEVERIMHEQVLETDRYEQIIYNCSKVCANNTSEVLFLAAINRFS